MFVNSTYTKCIAQFVIRMFFYCWISFLIILRNDLLLKITLENPYKYISIIVMVAVIFTWKKYDHDIVEYLIRNKKYIYLVYLALIAIWIQFGLEWVFSIHGNNFESFMFYEPIAILMGIPFSFVVFFTKHFFYIDDIRTKAIVLWLLYFFVSMAQIYLIIKKCTKKQK